MMKSLLIVPPNKEGYIRDTFYGCWHKPKYVEYSWPPLYLYQLNSIIPNSKVMDLIKNNSDPINLIKNENPDIILCNIGSQTIVEDLKFFKQLKQNIKVKIIVFGQHPTVDPIDTLKNGIIDICIRGEPENIIKYLIDNINNPNKLKLIDGVCFKEQISKKKNLVENLDKLPIPNRKINSKSYHNPLVHNAPYATILISRGCPFSCTFCTVPTVYGKTFRKRSVNNVIDELKTLQKQGYKELFFRDENLTLNKQYLSNLCEEMIKQNLIFSWICNSRVDTVDTKLLQLMKQSGCHLIKFGVESSNQKTLDYLKKGTTKKQIENTFNLCNKIGIETLGHFMIGNPNETEKDILNTLDFSKKLNPTYASFDILIYYPKTIKNKSKIPKNKLNHLHKFLFKEFYLRPNYILLTALKTKTFTQLVNKIKSSIQLWKKISI
jgi:anaerobic magnesium-protoporphyrin IX monomethyl ester cyclase